MITCTYDSRPCMRPDEHVYSPHGFAAADVQRGHPEHRPCDTCPRFLQQANPGKLGSLERAILLRLEPPTGEGRRLGSRGTASLDAAAQSAGLKLLRKGLLWKAADPDSYRHRLLWRSPLGQAVVEHFGDELRAGKHVEWSKRWAAVVEGLRFSR